jgi:prolyl-tRNA synthetase
LSQTSRTVSADEPAVNAQLLQKAGFVEKLMAGVYSYLPLGLRVLKKIERVVREEMDAISGQEILMPVLHPKENWLKTGGWDKIDVLFKIKSRTDKEYALGQSEEEVVTPLVGKRINTFRDLPKAIYQIHWKFRDELRAKSGLLRGREFLMKDMYSFHEDQEDFDKFYEIAKKAYFKIFHRLSLVARATEASGGSFTEKISYEFMVLTDAGEDDILYCSLCDFCVNRQIAKNRAGDDCQKCKKGKLLAARASEVGNVFDLGQKYSRDFDVTFLDSKGEKRHPVMGCYGIGISRLLGVIVEKSHDKRGIIWPRSVAPYLIHLLPLDSGEKEVRKVSDQIYESLQAAGIEVLYDDRDASPGVKFADSDLIGIPCRLVISKKTLENSSFEVKYRPQPEVKLRKLKDLKKFIEEIDQWD